MATMTKLPKDLVVSVTAEDIKHGRRNNPKQCPVALAFARSLAAVDAGNLTIEVEKDGYVYATEDYDVEKPKWLCIGYLHDAARAFVASFDRRKKVHPLSFSVALVPF